MSKQSKAMAAYREARAIYNKAVAPARAEYAKALKAFSEARAACEMAEIAYERATAPARAAHAPAWAAYVLAMGLSGASKAYDKAQADGEKE